MFVKKKAIGFVKQFHVTCYWVVLAEKNIFVILNTKKKTYATTVKFA